MRRLNGTAAGNRDRTRKREKIVIGAHKAMKFSGRKCVYQDGLESKLDFAFFMNKKVRKSVKGYWGGGGILK